jgi:hypothetical protein
VLATPEIAGLPYVISGMVAAGGLAAALSTADGLLLTIANALSHDLYYKMINPNASASRRVSISKALLLVVALAAAYVASLKIADILFLVSAAFSLAAASFFPALVLGVLWKRANKWGCVLGMVSGLALTFYYMATTQPWMRGLFGVQGPIADYTWLGIAPIAAGVFGVPLAFAVTIVVSLLTPAPGREVQELVEHVRYPDLEARELIAAAPAAGVPCAPFPGASHRSPGLRRPGSFSSGLAARCAGHDLEAHEPAFDRAVPHRHAAALLQPQPRGQLAHRGSAPRPSSRRQWRFQFAARPAWKASALLRSAGGMAPGPSAPACSPAKSAKPSRPRRPAPCPLGAMRSP